MDISTLQLKLSQSQKTELTRIQRQLHKEFLRGGRVTYLNESFIVLPSVFPPRPDSVSLVQTMEIQPGDRVLDVCCGSGVIGIMAAKRGAASVLGLDINPAAVSCAMANAEYHACSGYEARVSDVLSALHPEEQFNVVMLNPPFRDFPTSSMVEKTMWDSGLKVHKEFFSQINNHLNSNGRIYFSQANFGPLDQVQDLLSKFNWEATLTGKRPLDEFPWIKFYSFLVKRK